ncbi:hypothetical protein WJX72_009626 [[Myrmecia] bisecta]|uniref:Uncharacterized protein n=1 Tax=[Myrmecia] bisecta TaxID=41462 RepID=A0AAW1NZF7_9CHLO
MHSAGRVPEAAPGAEREKERLGLDRQWQDLRTQQAECQRQRLELAKQWQDVRAKQAEYREQRLELDRQREDLRTQQESQVSAGALKRQLEDVQHAASMAKAAADREAADLRSQLEEKHTALAAAVAAKVPQDGGVEAAYVSEGVP